MVFVLISSLITRVIVISGILALIVKQVNYVVFTC